VRVAMLTNTYTPHVGGVARSVEAFREELERQGCAVLVVAPEFAGRPDDEPHVVRVPAIQNFNGSDFSFPVPVPIELRARLDRFGPDVLHAHHPFLLGDTALRLAAERQLPVVFTHHTLYERYTHYVPGGSPALARGAIELAVGFANLCDAVVAPSASVAELLAERGVTTPLRVIPTGVDVARFAQGDRTGGRLRHGLPAAAFVVGHVGRLAAEKNLTTLVAALVRLLVARPEAAALVVGEGAERVGMEATFAAAGLAGRVCFAGHLERAALADAYAAMDAFLFTSQTETQGMVLTEAMAAGVPVVGLAAPGVSDVVRDGRNGRLLAADGEPEVVARALAAALDELADRPPPLRASLVAAARATAEELSLARTTAELRALYERVVRAPARATANGARLEASDWQRARRRLAEEWRIVRNVAHALAGLSEERSR
jgi:1,2-diacylglycerol 3-alpha-glucosyltransferase